MSGEHQDTYEDFNLITHQIMILRSDMTDAAKLLAWAISLGLDRNGRGNRRSRETIAFQAGKSLRTFERSKRALEEFFHVENRSGASSIYSARMPASAAEIEEACDAWRGIGGGRRLQSGEIERLAVKIADKISATSSIHGTDNVTGGGTDNVTGGDSGVGTDNVTEGGTHIVTEGVPTLCRGTPRHVVGTNDKGNDKGNDKENDMLRSPSGSLASAPPPSSREAGLGPRNLALAKNGACIQSEESCMQPPCIQSDENRIHIPVPQLASELFKNYNNKTIDAGAGFGASGKVRPKQKRKSSDPTRQAFDHFVEVAGRVGWKVPVDLNANRRVLVIARLKEVGGIDGFKAEVDRAGKSSFLTGRAGASTFKATFDWLLKPDNFLKIREGNYDDEEKRSSGDGFQGTVVMEDGTVEVWS